MARGSGSRSSWDGQVFAIDGHTLGAVGLKPPIRIWGIQAPEPRDAANVERVAPASWRPRCRWPAGTWN
jgi:hypothetical protein